MKKIEFSMPCKFSLGEEVWVIPRDFGCPASKSRNFFLTKIVLLEVLIYKEHEDRYEAVLNGVRTQDVVTSWENPRSDILPLKQVYKNAEDAERLGKWVDVDLDKQVYMNALGSRDGLTNRYRLCSHYYHSLLKLIEPIYLCDISFPIDDVVTEEDSELGTHGDLSEVRDFLIKCAHQKGLIQCHIEGIKWILKSHPEFLENPEEFPNLTKILTSLGISK